jgi:hypothetical protein
MLCCSCVITAVKLRGGKGFVTYEGWRHGACWHCRWVTEALVSKAASDTINVEANTRSLKQRTVRVNREMAIRKHSYSGVAICVLIADSSSRCCIPVV